MAAYHKMNRHLYSHKKKIRCASIVADRNTGELYKDDFIYYTEEEMEDSMIAWEHLFNFFCIWRQYDPRKIYDQTDSKTKTEEF